MPSKWGLVTDRLLVLSRRFSNILTKVQEFVWRLLELHIVKMVALFSVWVALQEVKLTISYLLLFFQRERQTGWLHRLLLLKKQVQLSSLVKIKTKVGSFRKASQSSRLTGRIGASSMSRMSFCYITSIHLIKEEWADSHPEGPLGFRS